MPTGKTVTAEQLWEVFDHALPPDVWVSPLENGQYEVISAKWMRQDFLPALKQQIKALWERGIPEEDAAGNCSGFALVCRLMLSLSAMEAHARAPAAATVIVKQEKPFGGLAHRRGPLDHRGAKRRPYEDRRLPESGDHRTRECSLSAAFCSSSNQTKT
jgi:hypothetical protein